ncbi:ABC transporter substrate-binding protein [Fervidicella metallireducens AeB]|uniref:Endolytic murein transglycosylase n=1 Tax=Fervidicella metallireducens AeB TaxID=1403537 RepID=A0A017S0H3_9CLOT|nr:endolytic transglycosylase MltG [Fervidicella metallireducens]EYE89675.1 ABC transporter substrate-binding protein [Fervidicella metallireducens AeB]
MGSNTSTKRIWFIGITVLILISPFVVYNLFLNLPISKTKIDVEFRVANGESINTVINNLNKKGLIKSKLLAKIYLKNQNINKTFKKGVYRFNTSMTPKDVFKKLINGELDPDILSFTVPEGYTVKQIADKLVSKGVIKDADAFIKEAENGKFDYEFLNNIPKDRPSRLEGYLFPDTYELRKGMNERDIIIKMLDTFNYVYKTSLKEGLANSKLTLDDVVIMASIIEREAKSSEERPVIASVFYNRLNINMPLQSCATVQYALGKTKPVLYFKDLEIDSPYNTYKNAGLPVGPIANPGKDSLEAALNPAKTEFIYFVAKGDGTHHFTKDYNEFLRYKKLLNN